MNNMGIGKMDVAFTFELKNYILSLQMQAYTTHFVSISMYLSVDSYSEEKY
jgi:hypothetical protein